MSLEAGSPMAGRNRMTPMTPQNGMPTSSLPCEIWAIGGGKGGVGKSFISSSLAICLARMGRTVTLIDLDLGGANLHTVLGGKTPSLGISDFIAGRVPELRQILGDTDVPNLRFINGFNDSLNIADLKGPGRERLLRALSTVPTRYLILDLGAGTSETTLDFYLEAHQQIVAATPEPTSIENAYRFLKSAFYRKLRQAENELGIQKLLETAMDSRNELGIRSPADLIAKIMQADSRAGARLQEKIAEFSPKIIVNQTRSRADVALGDSMTSVCRKYFGVNSQYLGHIDHDNAVWQSLRKRRPMIIEHPYSSIVGQFLAITKQLTHAQGLRAVV